MSTVEKLQQIGGLKSLTEVCIANEYGLDAVIEFRENNSINGFINDCKKRSAKAVKVLKFESA
jgi:hypothetical protein